MRARTFGSAIGAASVLVFLSAAFGVLAAQSAVITGKVTGRDGQPLGGATVSIAEVGAAVATTASGVYTLTVAPEKTSGQTAALLVRNIGYKPEARSVTLTPGTQNLNFQLTFDVMQLEEVVVTGVAEATERKNLTISAATVDASQINEAPAVTALGALEGKVAGVRLIQANGQPGAEPEIRLRASTAIASPSACTSTPCASTNASGPLIIVDGTITRFGLADINSEDVEKVEIVKGAAASSLFGSDAANGVIQVFTKRGRRAAEGQMVVSVRNEYGQSLRPKVIPTAQAHPYLIDTLGTYTDASGNTVNNGDFITPTGQKVALLGKPNLTASAIADNPYSRYGRPVYDPQTALLTHGAFYTNYISLGQRRGTTNYNVSFENTKQDGILLLLRGYSRQNFRVNVDQALTPHMDLSVGGFFGKSNNNPVAQGPGAPFFSVTFIEPYINLFAPNPDGTPYAAVIPHQLPNATNPLYTLANEQRFSDRTRYSGYGKLSWRIFDWLSAEGNYNFDQESSNFTDQVPKNFLNAVGNPSSGSLFKIDSTGRTFNTGVTLTGIRSFKVGDWDVRNTTKAAYVYEDQTGSNLGINATAFTVTATPEFSAVDFTQLTPQSQDITIRNKNYYVVSGFNVRDRYLVDGLVRWDGSSLFGPASRWQTYYRVSGAYRVTQDFHINGIDELKLRAAYGTAGLRPTFAAHYQTYSLQGGLPSKFTLGNDSLKPAHSAELELGTNVDFLGRFSLEYSYSHKETKDQILNVPLSSAFGYKTQWRNAGTMLGKTHELALGVILADRPELSWRLNVAADRTRQYITQLDVAPYLVGPAYSGSEDVTQIFKIAPGETYGVIYGTRIVRNINDLYDDPAKKALSGAGQKWSPDSVIVNEDGFVVRKSVYHTKNERFIGYVDPTGNAIVKIGDVNADFNASFTSTLQYKNFAVYALVDWVKGGNIYNGQRQWPFFGYRDRVYDQTSKPVATCPATWQTTAPTCPYSTGKKSTVYYQALYNGINPVDFFVESGTYVKIKELNVSYTFSRSMLEKLGLGVNSLRVGVIGRNLFTFASYSGYDPEVAGLSGDPFAFRFDGFVYPNFRTFTGFMELSF